MRLGLDLWCLPILPCLPRVTAAPRYTRGEVSGQLCLLLIHADKGSREIFLKVESRARQGNIPLLPLIIQHLLFISGLLLT